MKAIKNITRILFSLILMATIFATINVLAEESVFKLVNVEVKEKSDGVEVNEVKAQDNQILNNIVFTSKDDYIKYDVTIKNDSDKNYTINSITSDNISTSLDYIFDDISNVEVKANEEYTFGVQIKYIEEITNLMISDSNVKLLLNYTDELEEKNEVIGGKVKGVENNPKTGDKILKYVIISVISVAGIIVTSTSRRHVVKTISALGVISLISVPLITKALTSSFTIEFNNTIKEKEYTVSFNTDLKYTIEDQIVVRNNKIERPSDPHIEGYYIDGFYTDPEFKTVFDFDNTTITDTTTLYVHFITACERFEKDSWDTIRNNLNNNPNYYPVGCTKSIEAPDSNGVNKTYPLRLVNTSTPEVCNTPGYSQTACGTVIEFLNIVDYRGVDQNNHASEGWRGTDLILYLNDEFYNNLPSDLKSVIISTYPIVSGSGPNGTSENITAQDTDKNLIYLYSPREVGLDGHYDNKDNELTDTRTIDYYALDNTDETRRKKSLRGGYDYWWLRSARSTFTGSFCAINNKGTHSSTNANVKWGVVPVFRIG